MDVISRIFIGVKLPPQMTAALAEVQMTLKRKAMADLRWNDPNQFVLNLVPIGEVRTDVVNVLPPLIQAGVQGFTPMQLALDGLTGLPNNVQPRYVTIDVTGEVDKLRMLQASIQRQVGQLTGPIEGRGFEPHIVLGRLKKESEPERVNLGRGMRLIKESKAGSFTLSEVHLLRNAAADGVSYEIVRAFPLGAPAPARPY